MARFFQVSATIEGDPSPTEIRMKLIVVAALLVLLPQCKARNLASMSAASSVDQTLEVDTAYVDKCGATAQSDSSTAPVGGVDSDIGIEEPVRGILADNCAYCHK